MARIKQTPMIMWSGLTRRWFIATKYVERTGVDAKDGRRKRYFVAREKFDVTKQMNAIIRADRRRRGTGRQ